tara:strand:- start:1680 stop:3401 length:1722 start_codon:yes stop_codon:yes gene_type:complete
MVSLYIPEQEYSENLHNEYFNYSKASNLDVLSAALTETIYYNPGSAALRLINQSHFQGKQGEKLTKEEWAESEYFREGIEVKEDGIKTGLASLLAERKDERDVFNLTLSRSKGGLGMGIAKFGVGIAGSFLDPLNVASAFIPVFSTARIATMASKYGKTGARVRVGAVEGAVGATAVEPLVIGAAVAEQDKDYGLMDSFLNVTIGTVLGTGLHVGFGAISDRISKAPQATRDKALASAVGQAVNNQKINVGSLFDEADAVRIAKGLQPDDKKIVYNAEGKARVVDVLDVDAEGRVSIREMDGTIKILDESDALGKSIYDEDFEVTVGNEVITKQRLKNANAGEILQILDSLEVIKNQANKDGDTVSISKIEAVEEAINLERSTREGVELERPAEPDVRVSRRDEIVSLKKEIGVFIKKMQAKADESGLDKPKLTAEESAEFMAKTQKLSELQGKLDRADRVTQIKRGEFTPEQIEEMQNSQSISKGGLGVFEEHRNAVDEIKSENVDDIEIDAENIEIENQLMEEDLEAEISQGLLPEDIALSIREVSMTKEKADSYEKLTRAGAACLLGGRK